MNKVAQRVFRLVCGLVPLIFAGLFLASSVSLYRTVTADRFRESELESIFRTLPKNSRTAGNIDAILTAEDFRLREWNENKKSSKSPDYVEHFSSHGYGPLQERNSKRDWKPLGLARIGHLSSHGYAPLEKRNYRLSASSSEAQEMFRQYNSLKVESGGHERAVSISKSFESLLSTLAEILTTLKITDADVRLAHARTEFRVSLDREDPYQKYFYSRLALEKSRQKQQIKPMNYYEFRKQLAIEYLQVAASAAESKQAPTPTADLQDAEFQINQLRDQVSSLKTQLAQAEKSKAERWIPIVIAVISLLIALSANLISWRTERRQAREAELITLKRHELEQAILQRSLQIQEASYRIIKPTEREIELYSTHNSSSITSST